MVSEELTTIVRNRFKEGKRRQEIKDELWQQGYAEEDIDAAITKIQHDAIKQLPGIAWVYQFIENFETKTEFANPHITVIVLACCTGVLIILAAVLYIVFDPLNTQATERDTQRQADVILLQNALNAYYQENQQYPSSLTKLVPDFLQSLPKDPGTGADFSYHTADGTANYTLCVSYELQHQQCLSEEQSSAIPLVPTDTPAPTFAPQAVNKTGGIQ